MADVACRACRVPLSADVPGCAICGPIRPHLISADEAAEDGVRPALSRVSDELVRDLRERASYYRRELRERPGAENLARGQVALANALTRLLEAARKLQTDGLAAVENMSFAERAKLFLEWYAALPPTYRSRLRDALADHEVEAAKPLPARHLFLAPAVEP